MMSRMTQLGFPSISMLDEGTDAVATLSPQPSGGNGAGGDDGNRHHQVVIVGSGPAGLTAAIYAARANLRPLVIGGYVPGGQLMITSDVENFPGFPEGIQGPELMELFRRQAERFGAKIVDVDLERVELSRAAVHALGRRRRVHGRLAHRGHRRQRAVAGARERDAPARPWVSACATCDGFFFRGKKVAVVGGGDTALEEATFLTRFATDVVVLHRRDQFRGSKIMQQRALDNPKISVEWNKEVADVLGDEVVTGARAARHGHRRGVDAADGRALPGHRLPAQHRRLPRLAEVDEKGYLVVHDETRTPTSRASSSPATCTTTATARRSPRPRTAARPPSTPSAGSRRRASPRRRPPPPGR